MAGFLKQGTIKKVEEKNEEEEVKEDTTPCKLLDVEKDLEKENEELAVILAELDLKIEEGTAKLAAALDAQKAEETSPFAIEKQKLELTVYHMKQEKSVNEQRDAGIRDQYSQLEAICKKAEQALKEAQHKAKTGKA